MSWPTYRSRYLPALTLRQIQALEEKDKAFVVLPTGAIEQHGPHLPVGVDALLAQIYLDHALPLLPTEAPVFVAPPIQVGKSNEHDGFPGTLTISRESLRKQIVSVGTQLHECGFRRIGILNTHGGNISVIKSVLRELSMGLQMKVQLIKAPYDCELSEREAVYGIHANEVESSLMYAATPDMVEPTLATCKWIGSLDDPKALKPECAPATYAWKTLDISWSGVMGDATSASREKGALWLRRASKALAAELMHQAGFTK